MAIEPTLDATELDRSEESSTTLLYRAAIGPLNRHYYLPLFNRFEAADRGGISWNWAASLNTLNWLAFRQLWSAALAYAGAAVGGALLIFGIGRLVFRFSEPVEWGLLAAFLAALFIAPGLFANALLHAEYRKRMARALAANTTLPEACTMLEKLAPTQRRLMTLAGINAGLLVLMLVAYLNFPNAGNSLAQEAVAKPAAAPVAAVSAPARPVAPAASAPASSPARLASAPASAPAKPVSAAPPAATPVSAAKPMPSAPQASASVAKAPTSAASRGAAGTVQAAKPAAPASGPQEIGKVYRSEPTPAPAVTSTVKVVAGKATPPVAAGKPKAAAQAKNGFVVNVGLFAVDGNASNAMAKLKDAGLPAFSRELHGKKGKLTAVRVGPFESQADADAAAVKIRGLGLDALVAPQ